MNQQLELVLHKYNLELTIDEQSQVQDTIRHYCESHPYWMTEEEDGIEESKIADQISNLPFSSHHTKVITFTDKQLNCLINAMAEYQNDVISYGLSWPIDFGLVNEDGSFAGILADIDAKIEEVM